MLPEDTYLLKEWQKIKNQESKFKTDTLSRRSNVSREDRLQQGGRLAIERLDRSDRSLKRKYFSSIGPSGACRAKTTRRRLAFGFNELAG